MSAWMRIGRKSAGRRICQQVGVVSLWLLMAAAAFSIEIQPPVLGGITLSGPPEKYSQWTDQSQIRVTLEGVDNEPTWLELVDTLDMDSMTTYSYQLDNQPQGTQLEFPWESCQVLALDSDTARLAVYDNSDNFTYCWRRNVFTTMPYLSSDYYNLRCAAFSPDDEYLLGGAANGALILWDADGGSLIRSYGGFNNQILCLGFSTDSSMLAAYDINGGAVFSIDGNYVRDIPLLETQAVGVGFTSDTTRVYAYTYGEVAVWDLTTGLQTAHFDAPLQVMDVTGGGRYALLSDITSCVQLWDIETQSLVQTYPVRGTSFNANIEAARQSSDGSKIVACYFNIVEVWDTQTANTLNILTGVAAPMWDCHIAADNVHVWSNQSIAQILWDLRPTFSFDLAAGGSGLRTVVAQLHNGGGASAQVQSTIRLDATAPAVPAAPSVPLGDKYLGTQVTFSWPPAADAPGGIGGVRYDAQIGTAPGLADLYDGWAYVQDSGLAEATYQASLGQTLYCRARSVDTLGNTSAWSESSVGVLVMDDTPPSLEGAQLQDQDTGSALWTNQREVWLKLDSCAGNPQWLEAVDTLDQDTLTTYAYAASEPPQYTTCELGIGRTVFAIDSQAQQLLYFDDVQKKFCCWNRMTDQTVVFDPESSVEYYWGDLSPDGSQVVGGGSDSLLHLWSAQSGEEIRTFSDVGGNGFRVTFSPDGSMMAAPGDDNFMSIKVWNVQTGELIRTVSMARDMGEDIGFSADNTRLYFTTWFTADVWDINSGDHQAFFRVSDSVQQVMGLTPDLSEVLIKDRRGYLQLWNFESQSLGMPYPYTEQDSYFYAPRDAKVSADGTKIFMSHTGGLEIWDRSSTSSLTVLTEEERTSGSLLLIEPTSQYVLLYGGNWHPTLWDLRPTFGFELAPSAVSGSHTVRAQLHSLAGSSEQVQATINLDMTAPAVPSAPTVPSGDYNVGPQVTFSWPPVSDDAGGIGQVYYEIQVGTAQGQADLLEETIRPYQEDADETLSLTYQAQSGQTLFARVRALDALGNASAWSNSSLGVLVISDAPVITVFPSAPYTYQNVVAVACLENSNDAFVQYQYDWLLNDQVVAQGPVLHSDLTTKGEVWTCRVRACDRSGVWGEPGQVTVQVRNSPPTQPRIELRPRQPQAGQDIVINILDYSTDPDGDAIGYDFKWFKMAAQSGQWVLKSELNGSSQVSGLYIDQDDLWRVEYTPYESSSSTPQRREDLLTGQKAWDQVFVGENSPPSFVFGSISTRVQDDLLALRVDWTAADQDGEPVTVDLYWSGVDYTHFSALGQGLTVSSLEVSDLPLEGMEAIGLLAMATDSKGAMTQVFSGPIYLELEGLDPSMQPVVAYLLGMTNKATASMDMNSDGTIDIADAVAQVEALPPAAAAEPYPADWSDPVSTSTLLQIGWAASRGAVTYDVFFWPAGQDRPATPTLEGLTTNGGTLPELLEPGCSYRWQVLAKGRVEQTWGPVWRLTTAGPSMRILYPAEGDSVTPAMFYRFAWQRTDRVGTALRVELWRGGEKLREIETIYSEAMQGQTDYTLPADLEPGDDYAWRMVSCWLEEHGDPVPWVQTGPITVTPPSASWGRLP